MRRLGNYFTGAWRRLRSWIDEPWEAAVLFTVLAILLGAGGYFYLHGWGSVEDLFRDFYANLAGELISIGLTVLIIDRLNARRAKLEEKRRIVRQMAGFSNEFALEALRIATEMRWLSDGSLSGADLSRANLNGARFYRANLQGARLKRASLQHAQFFEGKLQGTNLTMADLQGAGLQNANLQGANLTAANLHGADLTGADLTGADLREANLENALCDARTVWPVDFHPTAAGVIFVDETAR